MCCVVWIGSSAMKLHYSVSTYLPFSRIHRLLKHHGLTLQDLDSRHETSHGNKSYIHHDENYLLLYLICGRTWFLFLLQFGEFALFPLSPYSWQVYWKCSLQVLDSYRRNTPSIQSNISFKSIGNWAVLVLLDINTTWVINLPCRGLVLIAQTGEKQLYHNAMCKQKCGPACAFCRLSLCAENALGQDKCVPIFGTFLLRPT